MNGVVNLRQFRKRKSRDEEAAKAEENRKIHGMSSKLKKQAKAANAKASKKLDGKRRMADD